MNRLRVLPALALIAAPLAACGGDDEAVTVAGQWARTSPAMASMGAAYMTLTASDDDALVGVSVPAAIAASAEIHEMVMADMDGESMDHGSMDGESMDHGSMDGDSMDMGAMVMQQIM
ncbi:MAG: copper chaperone PCu(A)C, partial [Ilumatobacteraceae bacterium]